MTRQLYIGAVVVCAAISSCAPSAFSPHFTDNQASELAPWLPRVNASRKGPQNALQQPLIFVVTQKPSTVIAYNLATQKVLWQSPADQVTSRVVVGKTVVVYRRGDFSIVARGIQDGSELWTTTIESGQRLVGISADSNDIYIVTEYTERGALRTTAATLTAYNGVSGSVRWRNESEGRIGAVAANNGFVAVPLRTQAIAILDGKNGVEVARVRSTEEALLWARETPRGIVFGGKKGIYALDTAAASGVWEKSHTLAARLPETAKPIYELDGYNAALSDYTAYDRNRLLWQIQDEGPRLQFESDLAIMHNYRFFFAFTSNTTRPFQLQWVYAYPRHDVVGATITASAVPIVSANGKLEVLDAAVGVPVMKADITSSSVVGVTFDVRGYQLPAAAKEKTDLQQSLTKVIWDPDRRFGSVRLFAVDQLAQLPSAAVTEELLKIAMHPGLDRQTYERVGDAIVSRHDKGAIPLYLKLLDQRSSFLEGQQSKAVGILARALGDLKVKDAVKPLLAHLTDHETDPQSVIEIVKALVQLRDKSLLIPFREFLLTYRCDPAFEKHMVTLQQVAAALDEIGGDDEKQLLSFIENDDLTIKSLRTFLGRIRVKNGSPKTDTEKLDKTAQKLNM